MTRSDLAIITVGLLSEVGTSWWIWDRAPYDTLRSRYEGSFLAYELEGLMPWAVILTILMILYVVIRKRSFAESR